MKKIRSNKGFTLIEILGAIVILGILMGIGVVSYTRYKRQAVETSYDIIKKNAISAAENYFMDNVGEENVYLHELVEKSYLDTVNDPEIKNKTCDGKVTIISKEKSDNNSIQKNTYKVYLKCEKHTSCLTLPGGNTKCDSDDGIPTN